MNNATSFVHLQCHSEYSLLEAPLRIAALIESAKKNEMSAVALTDNGVMYGAVNFYLQAKAQGIKPIIGCELYLCPDIKQKDRARQRLVLLCKDSEGYKNLIKLVTISHLEGFYYKPRIDFNHLSQYSGGLIAISPGSNGPVASHLQSTQERDARQWAEQLKSIYSHHFYLGIERLGNAFEEVVIEGSRQLGESLDIPLVVTNNVYYPQKEHAFLRDILSCIQRGKRLDDHQFRYESQEHYFKSSHDMATLFHDFPDAIKATTEIANKCNLEISTDQVQLPRFDCPDGLTSEAYLERCVWEGVAEKYPTLTEDIKNRVNFELDTIIKMQYANYFLIIHDFLSFCYQENIPVGPGRGSAAGSIVSYVLDITRVDPLAYQLLFERFLNPERVSMPDVDIDFCIRRRSEVIDYIVQRYGKECVSQIITFGTMQARAAIRDVGRVLNVPLSDVDRIAKLIPAVPGQAVTIKQSIKDITELNRLYNQHEEFKKLLDTSMLIEGQCRHSSTHAAGVVISREPLTSIVPLVTNDGQIATQFAMSDIEKIGLLKMDILGLRNLTVMQDATQIIKERHGVTIELNELSLDDPKTYKLLCEGKTNGVFQLESRGMRQLIKNLAPKEFEDIIALLALYRPGPLGSGMVNDFVSNKSGKTEVKYILPELESILKPTYGMILYQEQVMQIASTIGGFSLGEADMLRRAMGKKKKKVMDEMRASFLEGAQSKNINLKKAERIFELCYKFAEYGFNKSHSAAYALVSYQTAYLKAHYPVEYMTALLSSVLNNTDKTALYSQECKDMGIILLPPSIISSYHNFSVESDTSIRYGLGAIKNVGEGAIDSIVEKRNASPYETLGQFLSAIDLRQVNKRVVESLIKSGAMDHCGDRAQMLAIYERVLDRAQITAREQQNGQVALFSQSSGGDGLPIADLEESDYIPFSNQEKLRLEKEMIGLYLSGHPLDDIRDQLEKMDKRSDTITDKDNNKNVTIMGLLSGCRRLITKTKREMMSGQLEDLSGIISVIAFQNDHFEEMADLFQDGHIVTIEGRVRFNNDELTVIANRLVLINSATLTKTLFIDIESLSSPTLLKQIKTITKAYKGHMPLYFKHGDITVQAHQKYWISEDILARQQLESLLGQGRVWVG
jgi:DNA polymerase-3 subunit alpha